MKPDDMDDRELLNSYQNGPCECDDCRVQRAEILRRMAAGREAEKRLNLIADAWKNRSIDYEREVATVQFGEAELIDDILSGKFTGAAPTPKPSKPWGSSGYLEVLPDEAPTPKAAPEFKGWVAFGCGKHPFNAMGATAYNIDCIDCQRQPKLAWFAGSLLSPAEATPKAQEAGWKCECGAIFVFTPVSLVNGKADRKHPEFCPYCGRESNFGAEDRTTFTKVETGKE